MGTISWLSVFEFTPCLFSVVSQRCWPYVQGTANVTSSHRDMGLHRDPFQEDRARTDSQGPPHHPSQEQSSWASGDSPAPGIGHPYGGGNGPGTRWGVGPWVSLAWQGPLPGRAGLWGAADQPCRAVGQGLMALGSWHWVLGCRQDGEIPGEVRQGQPGLSGAWEQPCHLHRLIEAPKQPPIGAMTSH